MNNVKKVELLAPAGSLESLYAAVQAGANAVYLGGNKFSARAYASNFDEENMRFVISYCHAYGVKVYITVNTLIKEKELSELIEYISFLYKIGVDALIVQDTGVINILKKYFPDFEIHASTQMTVHNGEGAKFLKNLGIERVVLSRELSLNEIKYISKDLNIETEIFVHGALCICYSGQCLMSSIIGGRSGNRGRCAQPCRLPYTLLNKVSGENKKAYMLSPKDVCTLGFLKDVVETGTSSLKIEGRMKRPEYVAGVVSVYRKALDSIYEKGNVNTKEVVEGTKTLMQLFNREGFSRAYMFKNEGKDMMAWNFPKNTGVVLGRAGKDLYVNLEENLELEDGVRVGEGGFKVSKIIKDGKEVEKAYKGEKVKIFPCNYKKGEELYKTSDVGLLNNLSSYYKNSYLKRIELPLKVKFKIGENLELSTIYEGMEIKSTGDMVDKALKRPVDQEKIIENLTKTKDTPFEFSNIDFLCYEQGFIPISSINGVRRDLIEKIYALINSKYERSVDKLPKLNHNCGEMEENENIKYPKELVCVSTEEQLKAALDMGIENICIDVFMKNDTVKLEYIQSREEYREHKVYLKVPNIIKEEFESIVEFIEKNLCRIKGVITGNLGIINRFKGKMPIIGDYKLNIFNSYALEFYKDYLDLCAISVELNKKEISNIVKKSNVPIQVVLYGKTELMVSEYCPIGSSLGGKSSREGCQGTCKYGKFYMKDRTGVEFPVITDKFCRSHIYNSVSTNLISNTQELKAIGVQCFRVDFIDENYDETMKVLKCFKEGKWQDSFDNYTRGHFKRGVE